MIWVLFEGQHKYLWTDTVIIIKSFLYIFTIFTIFTSTDWNIRVKQKS